MKECETKIGLNELNRIAVICNGCGTTVEINVSQFNLEFANCNCRICHDTKLFGGDIKNEASEIHKMTRFMSQLKDFADKPLKFADVKFVIREESEDQTAGQSSDASDASDAKS
ncbi:hypothetical protein [Novipirellula rosea]|uniref:Uncharacterized protein n=1 Tax=Novipirellula rosea TaxID=1031540 RepID=A0ABP8ND46_9BACT